MGFLGVAIPRKALVVFGMVAFDTLFKLVFSSSVFVRWRGDCLPVHDFAASDLFHRVHRPLFDPVYPLQCVGGIHSWTVGIDFEIKWRFYFMSSLCEQGEETSLYVSGVRGGAS